MRRTSPGFFTGAGSRSRDHFQRWGWARWRSEEVALHRLGVKLLAGRCRRVQPRLVDELLGLLQPRHPRFLRDVLVNPTAQISRPWRFVQPFQLLTELHALHHSRHGINPREE